MIGIIFSGSFKVNDIIEIFLMKIIKKVKFMQMFKVFIVEVFQGDRVGMCVIQFDLKLLERGLVCSFCIVLIIFVVVILVKYIFYYKGVVIFKLKFYIIIGYEIVMGKF